MVTTSGHGRTSGVKVGYGTYRTAAPAARISRASSQQRCTAPSVMSVPITSACAGNSDSGKIWARSGLTSTRSIRPSSAAAICSVSLTTDRAIPCAPGSPFTRASMRIERGPLVICPLRCSAGRPGPEPAGPRRAPGNRPFRQGNHCARTTDDRSPRTRQVIPLCPRPDRSGPERPRGDHHVPARAERGRQDHRRADARHPAAARCRIGKLSRLPRREAKRRAAELLARFDLEQAAGRPVRTYSGGMRRRLDLAASLLGQPSVLFLDEPTTGLDPRSRLTMWEIIRELVGGGTTVLLTTQYLEEADQLADRIAVIDGGRVTAEGTPAELKARVGTAHLRLTITAGTPLARAAGVLSGHAAGPVRELPGAGRLEMPVVPHAGLVTDVVRALDAAGIGVDDIALRRPSLDEVFHALTRREDSPWPGLPFPRMPPDDGPPAAAPTGERAA